MAEVLKCEKTDEMNSDGDNTAVFAHTRSIHLSVRPRAITGTVYAVCVWAQTKTSNTLQTT